MSAVDTFRDALFGSPPSSATKPSREGALAAFTELYNMAVVVQAAAVAGLHTVATTADRDAYYATAENRDKLVYVNNNNGSATDPANGVYEYVNGSSRIAQAFYQGLVAVVQPIVDEAVDEATDAATRAEAAADRIDRDNNSYMLAKDDIAIALAVDDDGRDAAWIDSKGEFHATLADAPWFETYTAGLVSGFVDPDGYVSNAIDANGKKIDLFPAFTPSVAGNEIAVTNQTGRALVTYGQGQQSAPSRNGDLVTWIQPDGTARSVDVTLRPVTSVSRFALLPVFGQSNSVGGDAGMPGLDKTPLNPGRAYMFSGGIVVANASTPTPVKDSALGQMVDLKGPMYDGNGPAGPRAAQGYLSAVASDRGAMVFNAGVRGRPIAELTVGTVPFANLTTAFARAGLQAWAAGIPITAPGFVYVQGESDFTTATVNSYSGALVTLRNGVRDAARAVTGDSASDPVMLIVQPSSWTMSYYNLTTSAVPLAQMKAMADDPAHFAVIGPMYPIPHETIGLHLTSEGNRRLDEMCGDALARLARGAGAAGLYATSASRIGTSVTVTCRMPEGGSLATDTTRVTDPGQLGLVYRQADGTAVAISNIAVSGAQITFTLASAVAGTLGFALEGVAGNRGGPTSGPRCCIRDTFGATSADGQPRFNWMLSHSIAVA